MIKIDNAEEEGGKSEKLVSNHDKDALEVENQRLHSEVSPDFSPEVRFQFRK